MDITKIRYMFLIPSSNYQIMIVTGGNIMLQSTVEIFIWHINFYHKRSSVDSFKSAELPCNYEAFTIGKSVQYLDDGPAEP